MPRSTQRTSNPNGVECSKNLRLKSRYCAKATKFEEISHPFFYNYLVPSKQSGRFFQFGPLKISELYKDKSRRTAM